MQSSEEATSLGQLCGYTCARPAKRPQSFNVSHVFLCRLVELHALPPTCLPGPTAPLCPTAVLACSVPGPTPVVRSRRNIVGLASLKVDPFFASPARLQALPFFF